MSKEDATKTLHLYTGLHKYNMHTFIHTCAYKHGKYHWGVSICYKDEGQGALDGVQVGFSSFS